MQNAMKLSRDLMSVVTHLFNEVSRTLRHPMVSDAGLLAASQYVATGLGFLTMVVAARLLGPTEYGVAAIVMAYPTLLWSFVGVKSVSVTTRYIASFRATKRNDELKGMCKLGFLLDFIVSLAALFLVTVTGWWAAQHIFSMPEIPWLMVAYAVSFPFFSLTGTSWAILSSWQQFRWLAGIQVFDKGITLVLVLSLLFAGFGAPGMILGIAVGHVTVGLVMTALATATVYRDGLGLWWKTPVGNLAPLRKELGAFFGWNYLMVTFGGLMVQIPLILLGRLRGPEEAGFYRLATSLMNVGSYLEASLGRVAYPIFSSRWAVGHREGFKSTLKRWTLRGGLPVGTFLLLTVPLLPLGIRMAFGAGFEPMVLGAQVMMGSAAISAVFFWLHSFYYASGRIGQWTKVYGIYTVLVLGLAWFCIQRWGFSGMAGLVAVGKVLFTLWLAVMTAGLLVKTKSEVIQDMHCGHEGSLS